MGMLKISAVEVGMDWSLPRQMQAKLSFLSH